MEHICKNCKYFDRFGNKNQGECENKKIYYNKSNKQESDEATYCNYEDKSHSAFFTGIEFGCIHWSKKK